MDSRSLLRGLASALCLSLAACASVPSDQGRARVSDLAAARGLDLPAPDAARADLVAELTAEPLDAERAVRLALVNAPALEVVWADLGVAASELYAAGRLSNPSLEASRLGVPGGHALTLSLAQSLTSLLLQPARARAARADFAAAEMRAAAALADHAATTEQAYWELVGAALVAAATAESADAADAARVLGASMRAAGNLDARALADLEAEATEARLAAEVADLAAHEARTRLAAAIGLPAGGDWQVAERLPPAIVVEDEDGLIAQALASRLDLAAQRRAVDAAYAQRGVARGFRWLGEVTLGVDRESEPGSVARGPTLELELPLWSRRTDATLAADAGLRRAVAEATALEQAVVDGVRLARATAVTRATAARLAGGRLHPARSAITQRTQERVNFMLDGPFDLVEAKRAEYAAWAAWAEARAAYWAARAALTRAVGVRLAGPDADAGWLDATALRPTADSGHAGHH